MTPRPFPTPPPSPVFSPKACACRQGQAQHCPLTDRDPTTIGECPWVPRPGRHSSVHRLIISTSEVRRLNGCACLPRTEGVPGELNQETPQANWSYPNMKPRQKRWPHCPGGPVVETLYASTAGCVGLSLGQGTKILHVVWSKKAKRKRKDVRPPPPFTCVHPMSWTLL